MLPGLDEALQNSGKKPGDVASIAGIDSSTLWRLRTLKRGAGPEIVAKLAKALNTTARNLSKNIAN